LRVCYFLVPPRTKIGIFIPLGKFFSPILPPSEKKIRQFYPPRTAFSTNFTPLWTVYFDRRFYPPRTVFIKFLLTFLETPSGQKKRFFSPFSDKAKKTRISSPPPTFFNEIGCPINNYGKALAGYRYFKANFTGYRYLLGRPLLVTGN